MIRIVVVSPLNVLLWVVFRRPHAWVLREPMRLDTGKTLEGSVMRMRNLDGSWSYRAMTDEEREAEARERIW